MRVWFERRFPEGPTPPQPGPGPPSPPGPTRWSPRPPARARRSPASSSPSTGSTGPTSAGEDLDRPHPGRLRLAAQGAGRRHRREPRAPAAPRSPRSPRELGLARAADRGSAVRTGDTTASAAQRHGAQAADASSSPRPSRSTCWSPASRGRQALAHGRDRHRRRDPRRRPRQARARTWRSPSNASTGVCDDGRRPGSGCRPRSGRSRRSARLLVGSARPLPARSSTPATSATSTSPSSCPTASSRRWLGRADGRACSTASPSSSASTAPRSCSSTPAAWPSGWRTSSASASATTWSPPTTGRCRRTAGSRVETRLRAGELRALVATASLELGIDIGPVELVCQIGSPRSASPRSSSGSAAPTTPAPARRRAGSIPLTRDELVECTALLAAVRGRPPRRASSPPVAPLDILAQQIVAEAAAERVDGRTTSTRSCAAPRPIADLTRERLRRGRRPRQRRHRRPGAGQRGAYVHHDAVNGELRGRRGARLAALTSGGAIPETGDYRVVAEPDDTLRRHRQRGLGHRVDGRRRVPARHPLLADPPGRGRGRCGCVDAGGAPPTIPFWLGEAPARTAELSDEVSDLRAGGRRAASPPAIPTAPGAG